MDGTYSSISHDCWDRTRNWYCRLTTHERLHTISTGNCRSVLAESHVFQWTQFFFALLTAVSTSQLNTSSSLSTKTDFHYTTRGTNRLMTFIVRRHGLSLALFFRVNYDVSVHSMTFCDRRKKVMHLSACMQCILYRQVKCLFKLPACIKRDAY